MQLTDLPIHFAGDDWVVVSAGAVDNSTRTIYVHLRSTTRFRQQRNGKCPVQIADWLPVSLFDDAAAAAALEDFNYVGSRHHY